MVVVCLLCSPSKSASQPRRSLSQFRLFCGESVPSLLGCWGSGLGSGRLAAAWGNWSTAFTPARGAAKNHSKCLLPSSLLLSLDVLTIAKQLTSVMAACLVHFAFAEAPWPYSCATARANKETHQRPGFPLRRSICRGVARPLYRSSPL